MNGRFPEHLRVLVLRALLSSSHSIITSPTEVMFSLALVG